MGQLAGTEAPFCCRWAARLSDGHPTDGHKIAKVGFVLLLCLSLLGLFFFFLFFIFWLIFPWRDTSGYSLCSAAQVPSVSWGAKAAIRRELGEIAVLIPYLNLIDFSVSW